MGRVLRWSVESGSGHLLIEGHRNLTSVTLRGKTKGGGGRAFQVEFSAFVGWDIPEALRGPSLLSVLDSEPRQEERGPAHGTVHVSS